MTLKREEEFVQESLHSYFGSPSISSCEGDDPPDLFFYIDGTKIGVEVTKLSPFSFNENGSIENRTTQDAFGIEFIEHLKREFHHLVPNNQVVDIVLRVPVSNPKRFKKGVRKLVGEFIGSGPVNGTMFRCIIDNEKVKISILSRESSSDSRIIGCVENKNVERNLDINVGVMLRDRICSKIKKCKKLAGKYPIWLVLYSDYIFGSFDLYYRNIGNLDINHFFEKIFVVYDSGDVRVLYERSQIESM